TLQVNVAITNVNIVGAGQTFVLTAGADTFTGGPFQDSFQTLAANFTSADTLNGRGASDEIRILDNAGTATVADSAFTNVTNIETVVVANNVAANLTPGAAAQAAGILTVDASAVTTQSVTVDATGRTTAITITGGGGNDVMIGGGGADTFTGNGGADSFRYSNANFTAADTVTGGAGVDEIRITDAATVTDAQFANKNTVETIALGADAGGQTVTLGATSQTAGIVTVDASAVVTPANAVTINLSARTTGVTVVGGAGADVITAGSGADNLSGAGGADSFRFLNANFTSADTVAGGAGADEIRITDAATISDAQFTNVNT